jgi:hypothetical protein
MAHFKNISILNKAIALATGTLSILMIIWYSTILNLFTTWVLKNINTYTNEINDYKIFLIEVILLIFIILGFLMSVILIFDLPKKVFILLNSIFDTEKISNTLLNDSLISKSNYARNIFIISSIYAVLWHLKFLIFGDTIAGLKKETLLEQLSSLLFLISSIILIISFFKANSSRAPKKDLLIIKNWLILCSFVLLLLYMEEISWGQQFFNWESSGIFKDSNMQSETNFHNFIGPFFRFIYPIAGMGLFTILFLLWFYFRGEKPFWLKLILPHPNLIVLTFVMAAASFKGHSEVFEEMLAVFGLLYCLRIFYCLKYPNNLAE